MSDKRVVELPKILWQLILQGPILTFQRSRYAYRQVWNNKLDESPLRTITREQTESLERFGDSVRVAFAMRYNPSIPSVINHCSTKVVGNLCVFRSTRSMLNTTGSVVDKIGDTLKAMRWNDDPYISAFL